MLKKVFCLVIILPFLTQCSLLPTEAQQTINAVKSDLHQEDEGYSLSEMPDSSIKRYVQRIGHDLSVKSGKAITITLLGTDRVQGTSRFETEEVALTRGMLNSMSNEAELAGVLAHEIGHKVLNHKAEPKGSNLADLAFSKILDKASSNDALNSEIKSRSKDLVWTNWSQSREQEADEYAVKLLSQLGYHPQALSNLLARLSKNPGNSFFNNLGELKISHKSLSARAEHLLDFMKSQHLNESGKTNEQAFRKVMSALIVKESASTQNHEIAEIRKNLHGLKVRRQKLSANEFIQLVDQLREISKKNNLSLADLETFASDKGLVDDFMKENIKQSSPFWSKPSLSTQLKDIFLEVVKVGVAFIPVVNNVAALYEVLSGKDFVTGHALSAGERALSAIGLMTAAGTEWRLLSRGIEMSASAARMTRSEVSAIQKATHIAEEVREESRLFGRSKIGKEFNHHIEKGPLDDKIAENFLGQKYRSVNPTSGEKFYRAGSAEGNWWSRTKPSSQMRSMSENAVLPEWNKFDKVSEITVPKKYKGSVYEGLSSNMGGKVNKNGNFTSSYFHGGGNQVFIEEKELQELMKSGAIKSEQL